ncbi:flap endonuclease Xni [Ferrimonas lipolytica]|uniref:Flap endonuclease Xni n=1 Tax=Ferrimonas lipolytica TaxID=2724191 RepID=A0A6H1UEI4_9GAMM|nr:flap endonuclease Xni [Ferrimonas lipolytica]QIZ77039.1 flap endonuclease Xni [Ferrimonas lipolytica]
MSVSLLLIDALNLIRRIHAAVPTEDQNALFDRCQGALTKALRLHKPSHAILVWDGGHQHSWRREIYPEYKAQRKPMPEDLAKVLPQLRQALEQQGVGSVKQQQFEADDIIATIADKVANYGGKVLVLSTDKGFAQLHSSAISQWDHFSGEPIDSKFIEAKVGVTQAQLLDFWALAGDSGNGIPGVPGIGKKTAIQLLNNYPNIKAIYAAEPQPGKLGERLLAHKADARLSYQLVRLRRDIELNINLSQYRLHKEMA